MGYDASGFNPPEKFNHQEYTVVRILKHPKFSEKRLSNNIAILTVEKDIDLSLSTVNTACLPSCDNQFDYRFTNGTGTRCWVAGWGKDGETGQFQFIPRKVDLPLYDNGRCENALKKAMDERRKGLGSRFSLSPSELCAGGEVGKDACTGDGGSPGVPGLLRALDRGGTGHLGGRMCLRGARCIRQGLLLQRLDQLQLML